jgi:N-acetylmuramoyl-L-alanine amidase
MRSSILRNSIVLSLVLFSFTHAQKALHESSFAFHLAPGDTSSVSTIDSAGVLFISLNDFLRSLQLPASINDSTGKIECLLALQLVRFTDRNPFVVITERISNTATVYQMPGKVFRRNGIFFVPILAFAPLYERIAGQPLSFDVQRKLLVLGSAGPEPDIAGIHIEKMLNGSLITVLANKKLGDVETWLKPDGWLFVTITSASADTTALNASEPMGAVKKVLAFQSPTSLQLTFRVTSDVVQAETSNDPASNNLLISLRTESESEKKEIVRKRQESIKQTLDHGRNRWKLDVIVIDAGHGGKDPGCIGVNGTWEKNVTLGVAQKLGQLIEKTLKGVKVIYTRKTDKFIELYRRTQIANESSGKLFISIHCNAMAHKPSRMSGFEIYLLRPGMTQEAVAIASRENAVVQLEEGYQDRYRKLTEEEFIIVTMAQSAYMKQSEQFAESAAGAMAANLQIKNSGVKQAGFYVLVGASMPNVLVELGYLSNKKEEQFLRSQAGQKKVADALFRGIKDYRVKYERSLNEGMSSNVQPSITHPSSVK